MIGYTIEAARESGCFDRVVVSTEDPEIAEIASSFGAEIDHRSPKLATDQAKVIDICLEFLRREANEGRRWTVMACLYATAPMRSSYDIRATVDLLKPGRCDFAMAVTDYALAPHQALKREADNVLVPMWPDLIEKRASELPPLVVDNGSTYAVTVEAFERLKTFYGPNLRGHEMPRDRSIDIDTREDYKFALWLAGRSGLCGEDSRSSKA